MPPSVKSIHRVRLPVTQKHGSVMPSMMKA